MPRPRFTLRWLLLGVIILTGVAAWVVPKWLDTPENRTRRAYHRLKAWIHPEPWLFIQRTRSDLDRIAALPPDSQPAAVSAFKSRFRSRHDWGTATVSWVDAYTLKSTDERVETPRFIQVSATIKDWRFLVSHPMPVGDIPLLPPSAVVWKNPLTSISERWSITLAGDGTATGRWNYWDEQGTPGANATGPATALLD